MASEGDYAGAVALLSKLSPPAAKDPPLLVQLLLDCRQLGNVKHAAAIARSFTGTPPTTVSVVEPLYWLFLHAAADGDRTAMKTWSDMLIAVAPEDAHATGTLKQLGILTAGAPGAPGANTSPKRVPITMVDSDSFNLAIAQVMNDDFLTMKLIVPAHNWFAGTFTNLPTDKAMTISWSMNGNDTVGNIANVHKWAGLRPLYTYGDPTKYATYEWFMKDEQGRWQSSDPCKTGDAALAGFGNVPEQQVVPAEIAPEFLSPDGRYWSAWGEIGQTKTYPDENIIRITQQFAYPTATVAMRLPFTYTLLEQFIQRLQTAKLPGVFIDEIGKPTKDRLLQAIRLEDPNLAARTATHRTVVIIAREHGTEAASSWALFGALHGLLSAPGNGDIRKDTTWIFIPIEDPDSSASATFDNLSSRFNDIADPALPKEVLEYEKYFADYVNAGNSIDLTVALYNIEADEGPNILSPFLDLRCQSQTLPINKLLFDNLTAAGFITAAPDQPWDQGWINNRLYGWCALQFGSANLAFEVNDRYPLHRLDSARMSQLGATLAQSLSTWLATPDGQQFHQALCDKLADRAKQRAAYFKDNGRDPNNRNGSDICLHSY